MRLVERIRLSGRWGRFYERCWGGLKALVIPDEKRVYTIVRGPGRGIRILTNPVRGGTRALLGLCEPHLMQ
jgi:hypothetical protein